MKLLYQLSVAAGLGLFIYYYFFNFDNMSETRLLEVVLFWYVPLAFGLYGLVAMRIKNRIPKESKGVLHYIFSGKDALLLVIIILLGLMGLIGLAVLLLPLVIFDPKKSRYDISVSILGALVLVILLWLFIVVLWPAL